MINWLLLQPGLALLRGEGKVFGDAVDFAGDFTKDFLTPSQRPAENADAHEAALVNVGINGSRRDQAVNGDGSYEDYLNDLRQYANEAWSELLFLRADLSSK